MQRLHTRTDHHLLQRCTVGEGVPTDLLHVIGDDHVLQGGTGPEGVLGDGLDGTGEGKDTGNVSDE